MNAPEVTIIDYGMGNLLSVKRAFEYCGANVTLSSDPEVIVNSTRVVLPGVGAFANAMIKLNDLGLVTVMHELDVNRIPLLGICLGMQLLLDGSNEFGITAGLGLISGRVVPVPAYSSSGNAQKIPHIGWAALQPANNSEQWKNTILSEIHPAEAAYFVHSYMAEPAYSDHRIANCLYGGHKISAVIKRDHIIGCQFHPEKSGDVGLKIIRKFCID